MRGFPILKKAGISSKNLALIPYLCLTLFIAGGYPDEGLAILLRHSD